MSTIITMPQKGLTEESAVIAHWNVKEGDTVRKGDSLFEIEIGKAVKNRLRGRTSFVIAHRRSTITDADLILYMEDGNIVESGNHETLLARGGRYAALYNSQFS